MNNSDTRRDLARAIDNNLRESPVSPTGEVDSMVSMFTEKVLRTTTRLLPLPHGEHRHADKNVRRELDEAWDLWEKAWKAWREAMGMTAERRTRKEFACAGRVLKRVQREGVQMFFNDHARGLERRIRGDSMGFYVYLNRANPEISRKCSS